MEIATHGKVRVVLPHVEDELQRVSSLPGSGKLADYEFSGQQVRHLSITDGRLLNGRMTGIEAQRVTFDRVRCESMFVEDSIWTSVDLTDCALTRVVFRRCKILGARIIDSKFSNVIFDDCRIEYADLDTIHTDGPVVFTRTVFRDVTFSRCAFASGAMTDCELRSVTFDGGDYANLDLRGTDLSTVRGAAHLSGVLVTPDQRPQLAEAMVNELDLRYPEDDG